MRNNGPSILQTDYKAASESGEFVCNDVEKSPIQFVFDKKEDGRTCPFCSAEKQISKRRGKQLSDYWVKHAQRRSIVLRSCAKHGLNIAMIRWLIASPHIS